MGRREDRAPVRNDRSGFKKPGTLEVQMFPFLSPLFVEN